jgi:hypothetical protein
MKDFLNKPELLHHVLEQAGLFHNVRELYDSAVAR